MEEVAFATKDVVELFCAPIELDVLFMEDEKVLILGLLKLVDVVPPVDAVDCAAKRFT